MISAHSVRRAFWLSNLSLVLFNVVFVLVCIWWDQPRWWINIAPEKSALGWLQGAELAVLGMLSAAILITAFFRGHWDWKPWLLWLMTVGFLFLSLDERFQFHERLRGWYQTTAHGPSLFSNIESGNYVLLIILAVALPVIAYLVWTERRSKSVFYLILAAVFTTLAILMDAFTDSTIPNDAFRLEQFIEELFETTAETFLLLFFLNQWIVQLWKLEKKNHAS